MASDPALLKWATPRQAEYLQAIEKHGSQRKAADALGVHHSAVTRVIAAVKRKAAISGYAPDYDMTRDVPNPYVVRGTSTLYDRDGNQALQWVKTSLDRERLDEAIREYVEWLADDVRGLAKPTTPPRHADADLMATYVLADLHLGLYAWAQEAGEDFDLDVAERNLGAAMARLVDSAPKAQKGLIVGLGDLLHADDSRNVTPASGHSLDVDTRYAKVMQVALRTLKNAITLALTKHGEVEVKIVGGNHDPHSSFAVALCLASYYEKEPRVKIDLSPAMFRYIRFGCTLLGITHGHTVKPDRLPGIMASDRAEDWGGTNHRHWLTGHIHHKTMHEFPGCTVESFRTLAARDAWHSGRGYRAGRNMECITYHKRFGEVERHIADIRMIDKSGTEERS